MTNSTTKPVPETYVVINPEGELEDVSFHWLADAENYLVEIQREYDSRNRFEDEDRLLMYADTEGWTIAQTTLQ